MPFFFPTCLLTKLYSTTLLLDHKLAEGTQKVWKTFKAALVVSASEVWVWLGGLFSSPSFLPRARWWLGRWVSENYRDDPLLCSLFPPLASRRRRRKWNQPIVCLFFFLPSLHGWWDSCTFWEIESFFSPFLESCWYRIREKETPDRFAKGEERGEGEGNKVLKKRVQ